MTTLLFAQTGFGQVGPGAVQNAIASIIDAFFPGANLKPAPSSPTSAHGANPIVVSGGS